MGLILLLYQSNKAMARGYFNQTVNFKPNFMSNTNQDSSESGELTIIPEAVLQMNKAETENAVELAKRFPREVAKIKAKFLEYAACDQETAASMFYAKPVDNKGTLATGPSIRMAEIAANTYQNIKYGSRIIDISKKWVTVQGVAIDLENNLSYTAEIKRSIWSEKNGGYRYSQNLIETTIKAACAFAVRDAIFKVVPLGIFSTEIKEIKRIGAGSKSGVPILDRIKKALVWFKQKGVEEVKVLEKLAVKSIEEISEEHLAELNGIKIAIDTNESTIEEIFFLNKVNKDSRDGNVNQELSNSILTDTKGKKSDKPGEQKEVFNK